MKSLSTKKKTSTKNPYEPIVDICGNFLKEKRKKKSLKLKLYQPQRIN